MLSVQFVTYRVRIFCIENRRFSTKNEVVSLGSEGNRDTPTDQDEGKNVAILIIFSEYRRGLKFV
jgi:hypothetical protein